LAIAEDAYPKGSELFLTDPNKNVTGIYVVKLILFQDENFTIRPLEKTFLFENDF